MAFTQVNDGRLVNSLWKDLWKARLLEWLKMFLWRIRANVIPTRVNLQQKMQHIDLACSFCNNEVESSTHLFLDCQFASALWAVVGWGIRFDTVTFTSGEDLLKLIINPPNAPIPTNEQWIVTLNMALILDEIWNSRNRKLFKQEQADLIKAKHRVQIRFLEISKVFALTRPPPPPNLEIIL